jgi:predicted anti-sigma-YlaC factor YlaD
MRGLVIAALALSGCTTIIANTLSAPGKTYARDDDPELVRAAVPVILKTMEQTHDSVPNHRGLSEALARTCVSYGVAFIEEDADRLNETDVAAAKILYARARRMFLRGFGYGLDGLDVALPGSRRVWLTGSRQERAEWLARAKKNDVGLLYWTAAALGSAISTAKDDMKLVGQLPLVEQMMHRALELDEKFEEGALHEFYITWDGSKSAKEGGGPDSARKHMEKARALTGNKKLAPLVSFAEGVDVDTQNKAEFQKLLDEVVAFDVDSAPDYRLANILAQRRARWLLSRTADLFAE